MDKILTTLAEAFFWPVSFLVLACFCYAVVAVGGFLIEAIQRFANPNRLLFIKPQGAMSIESLELIILRQLEGLRLCSRVAPMLGLVATMIPLGPALVRSASGGEPSEIATGLAPAFSAVILSLISAATTFSILTVRRRWLLQEMNQVVLGASNSQVEES